MNKIEKEKRILYCRTEGVYVSINKVWSNNIILNAEKHVLEN